MRRYTLSWLVAVTLLATVASAKASTTGIYIAGEGGVTFTDGKAGAKTALNDAANNQTLGVYGFAVGMNMHKVFLPMRAEIEYSGHGHYTYNDGSSVSRNTLMVNAYYDLIPLLPITPYIGAGFGTNINNYSSVPVGSALSNGSNTSVAASALAGVYAALGSNWGIQAGYRFIYYGAVGSPSNSGSTQYGNELIARVSYEF